MTLSSPALAPVVSAQDVGKVFPTDRGSLTVLSQVSLEVAPGEFLILQGASGSGKSTLLSVLAGLDRATSGTVTLLGKRLDQVPEKERARLRLENVGFVFQAFHLLPSLTLFENIQLPLALRQGKFVDPEKVTNLLDRVDLRDRAEFFPGQLSGGEKQRAALARALVNDPAIVFADEPTGNLDSLNGRRVLDLLEEQTVKAGRTLVLVTHDPEIARRGRRRLCLQDGRLTDGR